MEADMSKWPARRGPKRYFGNLSFWRCMRHFGTYLRWLNDVQDGLADATEPPDAIRYRGNRG